VELGQKLRRRYNRNPAPRIQHQQILIATDHSICLGCLRQCQELVVPGIATGRLYLRYVGILYCKHADTSVEIGDECLAFFQVEVAIELATVEYNLNLSQRLSTGADIAEAKGC
jgi:hypothetical protein